MSRNKKDNTKFVTYEKFKNEAGFRYHLKFVPVNPIIDFLNSSIKEQSFQKGLKRLVQFAPQYS